MSPKSSPIDIANMIRIWPRPRRRPAARAAASSIAPTAERPREPGHGIGSRCMTDESAIGMVE